MRLAVGNEGYGGHHDRARARLVWFHNKTQVVSSTILWRIGTCRFACYRPVIFLPNASKFFYGDCTNVMQSLGKGEGGQFSRMTVITGVRTHLH